MGAIATFRNAIAKRLTNAAALVAPINVKASSSTFDAGGSGRRAQGWQPTRLGPTTNLWQNLDQMRARSRDQVRNNPWAASAVDNFESQLIGTGIRPRWKIDDRDLKLKVETLFHQWARKCDFHQRTSFYGMQAVAARELFEAGEVFCRFHTRPPSWKLKVPFQLQLIEGEQVPLWRNVYAAKSSSGNPAQDGMPAENSVRAGIEFDPDGRRIAYHMYKEHPGETMFYPLDGLVYIRVPADDCLHIYKPEQAGLLRGKPRLASVLTLLYEIDQYNDAEIVRKKTAAMFAGFIEKNLEETDILPLNPDVNTSNPPQTPDPGTDIIKLEPGTLQEMLPGEKITFSVPPQDQTVEQFLSIHAHRFAVGIGATYEQITGDLKGVNYSSIRAGLLDFRRKCEQFQLHIFMFQFCQPVAERFLQEAVLAGELNLPGYATDPEQYHDIAWNAPGWDWVDPQKDAEAAVIGIRAGLTTRAKIVAESGMSIEEIDEETAANNKRTDELKLVYDSDPRKVMLRGSKTGEEDPGGDKQAPDSSTTSSPPPNALLPRKNGRNKANGLPIA